MDSRPGRMAGEGGGEQPTDGIKPTIGGNSRSSSSAAAAPQDQQSVVLARGVDDPVQLGVPACGAVGEGTPSMPPREGDVDFNMAFAMDYRVVQSSSCADGVVDLLFFLARSREGSFDSVLARLGTRHRFLI